MAEGGWQEHRIPPAALRRVLHELFLRWVAVFAVLLVIGLSGRRVRRSR